MHDDTDRLTRFDRRTVLETAGLGLAAASLFGSATADDSDGDGAEPTADATTDDGDAAVSVADDPTLIEADPDAGFEYPYYLYAPTDADDGEPTPLLVEPVNSGQATDEFDVHRDAATTIADGGTGRTIADELGAPFIVPVFPRPESDPVDWTHYVHALDDTTMAIDDGPLERVDEQLLAMAADARARLEEAGVPADDEGIMLNGFSASGNFVERFASLHPEAVVSVTAGGLNGMPVLPAAAADGRTLPYHVGVADVEELTGEPFNEDAFADVNRFLYMGSIDMNDTIPFGDAWTDDALRETALDTYGFDMHAERFPTARAMYEAIDANAVFRSYERAAHTPRPAEADLVEFHERVLAGDDVEAIRADLGGGVPNPRAAIRLAPETTTPGVRVSAHAVGSAVEDGAIESVEWAFDDGTTAEGELVTKTFESPGRHAVTLTTTTDAGETHRSTAYVTIDGDPSDDDDADDDTEKSAPERYAGDDGVVDLGGMSEAFTDWQAGDVDIQELSDVFVAWQSDEQVTE